MAVRITRRRLARELVRLIKEQPTRRKALLKQTAAYLIDTRQTAQADLLLQDIADELMHTDAHMAAEVTTAFGLSDTTRTAVTNLLSRTTGARTVELHEQILPELLGGIVVRTPRQELDASVRTQLKLISTGGSK